MSNEADDRPPMSRDDAEFVSRVAEAFAPNELEPSRRRKLDAELRARVETNWRFGSWPATGLATAVLGALVLVTWLVLEPVGREELPVAVAPGSGEAVVTAAATWERDLLDPVWSGDAEGYDESQELPEDYLAIAGVFLDY